MFTFTHYVSTIKSHDADFQSDASINRSFHLWGFERKLAYSIGIPEHTFLNGSFTKALRLRHVMTVNA